MEARRAVIVLSVSALALTACAARPAPPPGPPTADPGEELTTAALVLDNGDDRGAMLCLGFIEESYPPRCAGPAVHGWDWATVDENEVSGGVTWGEYEVVGTWDGTALTLTRPPAEPDRGAGAIDTEPFRPTSGGPADADAVARALADYGRETVTGTTVVAAMELDGRARVGVVFDDGALQSDADARYGDGVVVIESCLRPVEGAD